MPLRSMFLMSIKDDVTNREEGVVLLERMGAIATITLSRPNSLNALTWGMYQQLEAHMDRLVHDETLRVVILRGAGKAFAAGTDISQFQGFSVQEGLKYDRQMERVISKPYN